MTTLYIPTIVNELSDHFIFLDTGVFITAAKSESFAQLLIKLRKEGGCSFSTVPSVLFEFTSGSNSLDKYNKRAASLKSIVDNIDSLKFLDDIQDFYVVMAKLNAKNASETDFLLAACLYNYRHVKTALITGDFKAYPPFIPRTSVITVEHDKPYKDNIKQIVNLGIYKFDRTNYAKAAQSVLSEQR